ncbi:MAG TPA: RsmB/NOP family class I SAM-dependent RNA methyltransferase, partial [Eoetvoesiella sp.]
MNNTERTRRSKPARSGFSDKRVEERRAPATGNKPYVMSAVRIEQVRSVLGEILQWEHPADMVLSRWLRAHPKLGSRDRSELAEGVFDVLRHLRRYRQFAESGTGPAARRLAILGLASVFSKDILNAGLSEAEQEW